MAEPWDEDRQLSQHQPVSPSHPASSSPGKGEQGGLVQQAPNCYSNGSVIIKYKQSGPAAGLSPVCSVCLSPQLPPSQARGHLTMLPGRDLAPTDLGPVPGLLPLQGRGCCVSAKPKNQPPAGSLCSEAAEPLPLGNLLCPMCIWNLAVCTVPGSWAEPEPGAARASPTCLERGAWPCPQGETGGKAEGEVGLPCSTSLREFIQQKAQG